MSSKTKKVAVIGSGIAGIAAAIRLAVKGHQVDVYEANSYPGGKLSEMNIGKYRFDAGPSLFTMPALVKELFDLCDERMENSFNYTKLDVACHYFFEDGTFLRAFDDPEKLKKELVAKTNEQPENIEKALENSSTLYRYLGDMFMFRSLHDPSTFVSKEAFKAYGNIWKMDFFRTMNQANEAIFTDEKLVQMFNRYATYNGSNPYDTPATMNIIPHLEFGIGAFFPEGGMHQITQSLFELAKRQGVRFSFNARVDRILHSNKHISGVSVKGERIAYDSVVSNMDIAGTYNHLLPDLKHPKKLLSQPKSSSALIYYWGIKKSFEKLNLHNIFFSKDYRKEFQSIFKEKGIHDDPTVYINITSKYNKSDAPAGCENWFTMINVPNNSGQDWDRLIATSRENIINKLSRMLGEDIRNLIEVEQILEPRTIESKTGSSMGALYGNSSNNKFAAFLRHANFSKKLKNLYFCGGSVHPGGGIPMCLSSAKIVDRYFG